MVPGGVVQGKKRPRHRGLPQRLKEARKAAGILPTRLSVDAGLSRGLVASIEAGSVPRLDILLRIAAVLRVSPCWLAYGAEGRIPWREKTPRSERRPEVPEPTGLVEAAEEGPPYGMAEATPEAVLAALGPRLRQVREAAGLSVRGLGIASETSDTTVRLTEEGHTVPTVATVEALAKALRCSPCWLAFGEGEGAAVSDL